MTTTDAQEANLYEVLGGAEPLKLAVSQFYERLVADPVLQHYFEGVELPALRRHQVLLLAQVLGGPTEYDGRDLGEAHAGLDITGADYDRVVNHLVEVLVGLGVDQAVIDSLGATVTAVKPSIATADAAAGGV